MGADCRGVEVCDGGPCSLGFFRRGSSGSVSLSSDIRFDFRGSTAGFGTTGGGVLRIGG
jgi:hypothetical protein